MEKYTPHYDLAVIKADVIRLGYGAFTASARDGARRLKLSIRQMQSVICALEKKMLYKSMTTYSDPRIWQDVYLIKIFGTEIYIRVTYRPSGGPPVISFKERVL
ncbi:type II toxin-antitoxin system MqsR family toxin [Pseudomonas sp.]|uniref:type II toxin-antitoxin system MqsR family toxin n=1 Tax=Pseudomonas sp. TaxID=306 RepID=UPI0026DBAD56|nr:type II toxin-antitoxin system MqsR family toxin [Pseudomonas sp.]MDO4236355.1 type II toxin-antitoxin system MqsR family toxin [Pseudomonas sp.]